MLTEILRQHLPAALEAAARDHDRPGAERALSPVATSDDDAVDAPIIRHGEPYGLRLVEQLHPVRALEVPCETLDDRRTPAEGLPPPPAWPVRKGGSSPTSPPRRARPGSRASREPPAPGLAESRRQPTRQRLHQADEARIEPPILGDAKPRARVPPSPRRAPPRGPVRALRSARRDPTAAAASARAHRSRETGRPHADDDEVVARRGHPTSPAACAPAIRPNVTPRITEVPPGTRGSTGRSPRRPRTGRGSACRQG